MISSDTFGDFYKELINGKPRNDFYLYGKRFCIDVKAELEHIMNLSLMMYKTVNTFDTIQELFEDLYFRIYEDKFTIEVNTIVNIIIKNFDSGERELLNQEQVKIKIRKHPKSHDVCFVYEIADSKENIENFRINPLRYPQTIFDISVGILRIYTSPRIEYIVNNVNYSPGCPRFLEPEDNLLHSFKNYYLIKINELQTLLQKAYSFEDKIKLTIERFSIACGRKSDYDRLLDLVIALEILLSQGETDSIKYKIIIRLLNLLSNNREKREMLHDKMGALYTARSAIVHRSDIKPAFECINNLESYEYIIRTAITVFIDTMQSLGLDHKKMIDKLDYDKTGIYEIEYCGRFN